MFDKNGVPLYWLVFSTNHLRGLEEMKRAMWAVDKIGTFRFSDEDSPNQLALFESYNNSWLADELAKRLAGKTMAVSRVKEYVLTDTPCYLFKAALKSLEVGHQKQATVVRAPPGRKPGSYVDEQLDEIHLKFGGPSSLFE